MRGLSRFPRIAANPRVALAVIAVHLALLSAVLWFSSRKPGGSTPTAAPTHVILQTVTLPPLNAAEPPATRLQPPSKARPPEPAESPRPARAPAKTSAIEDSPGQAVIPAEAPADRPAAVEAPTPAMVALVADAAPAPVPTPREIEAPEPVAARPDHERCPHAGYPLPLKERGIEGTVWLRVQVTLDGLPAAVTVLRGSGFRLFDEAALQAARDCRFIPARRGAERLASWVEFPMRFALDS